MISAGPGHPSDGKDADVTVLASFAAPDTWGLGAGDAQHLTDSCGVLGPALQPCREDWTVQEGRL